MVTDKCHLLLGVVAVASRHHPGAECDHQLAQVAGLAWVGTHRHAALCDAAVGGGAGVGKGDGAVCCSAGRSEGEVRASSRLCMSITCCCSF